MAYSEKQKNDIFNYIFDEISNGRALRNVLKDEGMPSSRTFDKWLEEDEEKVKRYVRACEKRADHIFEEIIEIADDSSRDTIINKDGLETMNSEFVQRSRLRVDARKWIASKLNPKKYGDKTSIDHSGETKTIISFED